ncbi:hypothetical protein NDU88_011570 [Pleurodeles waltl]|uniref:Uncharacterized protein n=1 Tax=Pleurodeles waltl TaxID=8319 RepID=A0AAV7R215_PLEWA|nr:hypothetical protein NDU88_011570 [Pleurodeles waltl]
MGGSARSPCKRVGQTRRLRSRVPRARVADRSACSPRPLAGARPGRVGAQRAQPTPANTALSVAVRSLGQLCRVR